MAVQELPEILLDARAVAQWLRLSVPTVYEQASRGVIPHIRLWRGNRRTVIRFRREDIQQILRERRVPSVESEL